ncbi:MAG: radical SAM protein [Anaerolineae bacterium]|nr:MAG: radical SAM protein [Anaerolineae bacterium]
MGYSVGIGLTNDCNLNCAHCYRPTDQVYRLSLDEIKTICQSIPVDAMGMGTGENSLHPQFREIVEYLRGEGIKLTMASNGYSLNTLPDEIVSAFHDVEVSVDFATEREQDLFRGQGNWRDVHAAIERCAKLGIEVSMLATLMNTNYDQVGDLVRLARSVGTNLRVNVYQSVNTGSFRLGYEQFWSAYQQLFASSLLVSCTEPVVRAVLGMEPVFSPCGRHSIRFTPQGHVIPCVYWPKRSLTIEDIPHLGVGILDTPEFQAAQEVPPAAADCPCQGGCASRRALSGELDRHDEYCPWVRGDKVRLEVEMAPQKDLPRGKNVCTTIVM